MKEHYIKQSNFYNSILLQETLKYAVSKGAKIISTFQEELEPIKLHNVTITEQIDKIKYLLSKATKETSFYNNLKKQLQDLEQTDLKEYTTFHNETWIQFEFGGYKYYLQYCQNPFLEGNTFTKIAHKDLKIEYCHYGKNFDFYSILNYDCYNNYTLQELQELAKKLFNAMIEQKPSEIMRTKIRVANIHNNKYHYETRLETYPIPSQYYEIKINK